jgi:hypothetical protein
MKKLFVLATILTGTLFTTSVYSQVSIHVGFNLPVRRVYVAPPPPPVVYQQYPAPAPVYQDGYDQNGYSQDVYGQAPTTVVYENEFPGYAYYNYPVWNGHYRDRVYYTHYRPYFQRDYRGYFNRGRFDRERFEHERLNRGRYDHDRGERGEHRGRW